MHLSFKQLEHHLKKPLTTLYALAGAEPFLLQEAVDAVRCAAHLQGIIERFVFQVDANFDWRGLLKATAHPSLFGTRSLVELCCSKPPSEAVGRLLEQYIAQRPSSQVLLIRCEALNKTVQQSGWFQTAARIGIAVTLWPLPKASWPSWLQERLSQVGLSPSAGVIEWLASRTEGNLLAAAQAIQKLRLLVGSGELCLAEAQAAIEDQARFELSAFAEAILSGKLNRSLRILQGLQAAGVESPLILWQLLQILRSLSVILYGRAAGQPFSTLCRGQRISSSRQNLFQQALKRLTQQDLASLFAQASAIDQNIKGVSTGNLQGALQALVTQLVRALYGF